MAVIKEWVCVEHGEFTGSHPICPNFGCTSDHVTQEFRTAPGFRSDYTKRTDAGLRKSAEMYGINNFKSGKAGDTSFAGRADPTTGSRLLWGDESKQVLGHSFAELSSKAQKPLEVPGTSLKLTENNGMREAAREAGITRRKIPRAGEVFGDSVKDKAIAREAVAP